jgi:hypothetical protein
VIEVNNDIRDNRCELCGEKFVVDKFGLYVDEVGEFWNEKTENSVLAHAQCGYDAELEIA